MSGIIQTAFRILIGEMFQTECLGCGALAPARSFCDQCFPFPKVSPPSVYDTEPLSHVRSEFWLSEAASKLVHGLKFRGWYELREEINLLISTVDWSEELENTVLIPVPLARGRLIERGFNQSEIIARCLSHRFGLSVETDGLWKEKETKPQSQLMRRDRKTNLKGAFRWSPEKPVPIDVVLVDDIFTTGETLKAAGRALKEAGAKKIRGWTLFRAPSHEQKVWIS